jgi:hypothetical protein
MDQRPRWQVQVVFDIATVDHARPGRPEATRLERDLVESGRVRRPKVGFSAGQMTVTLWLKGVDELDATASALAMLDHAVARVPGLHLQELRWRRALLAPRV